MYNQTATQPWSVELRGKNQNQLFLVNEQDPTISVRIISDDLNMDFNKTNLVNHTTNKPVRISSVRSNVRYGHYNHEPVLCSAIGTEQKDIMLVTLDMRDLELLNVKTFFTNILYANLNEENEILTLIITPNTKKPFPGIQIVTQNRYTETYNVFKVSYSDRTYEYDVTNTTDIHKEDICERGEKVRGKRYIDTTKHELSNALRCYRPTKFTYVVAYNPEICSQETLETTQRVFRATGKNAKVVTTQELRDLTRKVRLTALTVVIPSDKMEEYNVDGEAFLKRHFWIRQDLLTYLYVIDELGHTIIVKKP